MTAETGTEGIEKLYKCFSVLADSKDKISEVGFCFFIHFSPSLKKPLSIDFFVDIFQHSKEYLEIIAAVKGVGNQKILASQFITRFFKNFPDYSHEALDALLDLCEDEDIKVSFYFWVCLY